MFKVKAEISDLAIFRFRSVPNWPCSDLALSRFGTLLALIKPRMALIELGTHYYAGIIRHLAFYSRLMHVHLNWNIKRTKLEIDLWKACISAHFGPVYQQQVWKTVSSVVLKQAVAGRSG